MADYRDHRYPGRHDPRGFGDRGYEEQGGHSRHDDEREQHRSFGGFGRGSSRDRMGSEQFRAPDDFGGYGEHEYRDFGRGQPGGAYEHSGNRDYRHGSGYGGFGQGPGESGAGFGSGRTYAAEPGWGPDYGEHGRRSSGGESGGARGYEGQGGHPGAYGTQRGGYGGHYGEQGEFEPGRFGQRHYGHDQYGQGQRQGYSGLGYSGQGYAPSGRGFGPSSVGGPQYGQGFGEAGHSYAQQGFGQSQYGYGGEGAQERDPWGRQRRYGRGPKGYQRSDERLKEDISERLMAQPYVDSSEVSVEVKEGKVTLEGTVPERRMKHRIEDIVDDCMGVKDIDNRIRVAQGGFGPAGSETRMSVGGGQDSGSSGGAGQGLAGSSAGSTGKGK